MSRNTRIFFAMILLCCFSACKGADSKDTGNGGKGPAGVDATFFSGGTLIPGDGSPVIQDVAILVENGKFKAIGKRGEVKPVQGAGRVDLTDHFIMPVIVNL